MCNNSLLAESTDITNIIVVDDRNRHGIKSD